MKTLEKKEKIMNKDTSSYTEFREYLPQVDLSSNEKGIFMEVNLPGISKESIDISMEKDILTTSGKANNIESDHELYYAEYEVRNFRRSFRIDDTIDVDKTEATYKDGTLKIYIPLVKSQAKKIAVQSKK